MKKTLSALLLGILVCFGLSMPQAQANSSDSKYVTLGGYSNVLVGTWTTLSNLNAKAETYTPKGSTGKVAWVTISWDTGSWVHNATDSYTESVSLVVVGVPKGSYAASGHKYNGSAAVYTGAWMQ